MAESVDALVSNTSGATHPGSIPGLGTEPEKFPSPVYFCHLATKDMKSTSTLISENRTYLMGISMIIIMFFHQYFVSDSIILKVVGLYGNYGVDVFLFVSGFGLAHSLQKNSIPIFYKRRLLKIIPACILIGIIKILITDFAPSSITFLKEEAFTNLRYGWRTLFGLDLWFIRAILFLYLITPLINLAFDRFNKMVVLALGFLIGTLLVYFYPFHDGIIDWVAPRIPAFVFGMYIAKKDFTQTKSTIITSIILIICAVVLKAVVFMEIPNRPAFARCDMTYVLFAAALPLVCTIMIWLKKYLSAIRLTPAIYYIGGITLEIYLCHEFLFKCTYNLLQNSKLPLNWGGIAIAFAASILCAATTKYLIATFLSRRNHINNNHK